MKVFRRLLMSEEAFPKAPLTRQKFLLLLRALSRRARGLNNDRRRRGGATTIRCSIGLLLIACITASAPATADDFYQGKRITLVVGFNPGGGIDTAGRLIAKHLGRFIAGNPGITVQNMEGAGGVVAANYVNRAAPDGLTLGMPGRSWFIVGAVKNPAAKFDPATMTYVGSSGVMNSALWMRPDSGITSFAQLLAAKEKVVLGALSATSQDSMAPALLAQNGVPVRVIRGYNSSAKVLLAIEQGEVPGIFHIVDGFAKRPDLIEKKVVVPILQTQPMFPGLPLFRDVIRASDRPLANLVLAGEEVGVLLAGPPGIPADRVTLLRQAFAAMAEDKDYQADLARMDVPRGTPLAGDAIAAMMRTLVETTTPAIAAAYERLKE
jgi:tripartite-type tricarboxylate transporter receptor subunit TctC